MSLKITHAGFVKNEAHCIQRMFDAVLPWVDDSYELIDDTTKDDTEDICKKNGVATKKFTFINFGKAWNTVLNDLQGKTDWILFIAPDETITEDFGKSIRKIVDNVNSTEVDGAWFSRRHWEDLDMQIEYTKQNWYPDWQLRLVRADYPRIHAVHYVHEVMVGFRGQVYVKGFDLHHFNMYYKPRIDYNFDAMNKLYAHLAQKQKEERELDIWPD